MERGNISTLSLEKLQLNPDPFTHYTTTARLLPDISFSLANLVKLRSQSGLGLPL